MTTHPGQPDELIPRPEQNPEALRAALAVVDPARLPEMQAKKDEAFAEAAEQQSVGPVRAWLLIWAQEIEIARRPALASRLARARHDVENADEQVMREALATIRSIYEEAHQAVTG